MFSKFFNGQNEQTLEALEMQWRLEYAKARRKFAKNEEKKKRGRPALGTLKLPVFDSEKTGKSSLKDLTELARSVATTREGQRVHKKAAESQEKAQHSRKTVFCFDFLYYF